MARKMSKNKIKNKAKLDEFIEIKAHKNIEKVTKFNSK